MQIIAFIIEVVAVSDILAHLSETYIDAAYGANSWPAAVAGSGCRAGGERPAGPTGAGL